MIGLFAAAIVLAASSATSTPSPIATAAASATPLRTPPPGAHVWQGIAPGDQVARVHARLGQPLLVRQLPDGSIIDWYPTSNKNGYMIVAARNGVITYVRAFPSSDAGPMTGLTDPWGVTPGDEAGSVQARRGMPKEGRRLSEVAAVVVYDDGGGFSSLYEFDSSFVHAISLFDAKAPGPPPAGSPQVLDPHDGASTGRAYVVQARTEADGVAFERYYATHRGGCPAWTIANQTTLSIGGRHYDQLDLTCANDHNETSIFFDITSFFGKT